MTAIKAFIMKHPVRSYFALTFLLSWSGVLLVIGPHGIIGTKEQFERMLAPVVVAMLVGPSVAGLLMTGLVDGRSGFRALWDRVARRRVGVRWLAVALLTAPAFMVGTLVALSALSPEFLSGMFASEFEPSVLILGIMAGLGAGIFEELGWTGFAIPRLRQRHTVVATGLFVGILWGAWHLLTNLWGSGSTLPLFLSATVFCVLVLPAYRVLMVWVNDRSGSLSVAMLMHGSLTASSIILTSRATGESLLIYNLVLGAALWVLVALVVMQRNPGRVMFPISTSDIRGSRRSSRV